MARVWWFSMVFVAGCGSEKAEETTQPDTSPDTAPTDIDDTGDTGPDPTEPCVDDSTSDVPVDATWIVLDGTSTELFSFADDLFNPYTGYYGTYDFNTTEVYGGNGFRLERPGQVVGVSAKWANLPSDEPGAATVWVWPDFSSDGYVFDIEAPHTSMTRCLTADSAGTWVDYALPEPVVVSQAFHVFAGFHRGEGEDAAELMMENEYNDAEPYYTGARFPDVDNEVFYLGASFPWYVWQVRLAVIYDEPIEAADKPFQLSDVLSASSRVAWGDYDGDGDDDLMSTGPTLYANLGDGTFSDVTSTAIPLGTTAGSGGGVWGDYDNDGCLDFFGQGTSYSAGEVLLHNNCDGTFEDVIAASGILDMQDERDCDGDGLSEHSPTEGSAWLDLDGDGFLDLYLANYECSSEHDYFENYNDFLWRNNGDGTFSDWTEAAGIPQTNQAGRGATTGDFDRDGDTDLFVSNYRLDVNFMLENLGDGTVANVASGTGTGGVYTSGAYGHTIGSVFGDIDNDGEFDLVSANLAHPFYYHFSDKTMVLMNDGAGAFTDEAIERGIYYRETHSNPNLFDADNDGDLELFITSVYGGRDSDFYENDGNGVFTLRNYESGLVVQGGWGSAVADYDQDGDVDMLAYSLYRNTAADDGTTNWLEVQAVGTAHDGGLSNRSAIGAVIGVSTSDNSYLRHVSGGSGTGCQDSLTQHFGLDTAETAEVTVWFPGGAIVTISDVAAGQKLWVSESGDNATGWTPPF